MISVGQVCCACAIISAGIYSYSIVMQMIIIHHHSASHFLNKITDSKHALSYLCKEVELQSDQ